MQSHSHVPTHTILKPRVACCISKTLDNVLPHLFSIQSFSTLLITLFAVALIKFSVCLCSTFYLLFFHKVMFSFLCPSSLLNTVKCRSNQIKSQIDFIFYIDLAKH